MTGDALQGETDRLRVRIRQVYDRLETQLRQILREAEIREGRAVEPDVNALANLLLAVAEGRMHQYLRSRFKLSPLAQWEEQWTTLQACLFRG